MTIENNEVPELPDFNETDEEVTMSKPRRMAALSASWEIEKLCQVMRNSAGDEGADLIVRGMSARIEDLSHVIMSALTEDHCTTQDLTYQVTREHGAEL